ncbi:hypothetical protein U0070_002676 [Myodes glareolus]|uniref:Uncharacterized protein n=1 Tax=Myodes glareolus TaxID=447135 RepID=A0AAW0HP21_MYOGA
MVSEFRLRHQGEGQAGVPGPQEGRHTPLWPSHMALVKLVEAIRTNYNRLDELHHHWQGNVLGPKSASEENEVKDSLMTCSESLTPLSGFMSNKRGPSLDHTQGELLLALKRSLLELTSNST